MRPRSKDWLLSREAFDKLLARLDPDRDRAGEKYEMLRRKLIVFFEFRGSPTPEEHADESINRVNRRIDEGELIHDLHKYLAGVARMVAREIVTERKREQKALAMAPSGFLENWASEDIEWRSACFEKCLADLPVESRALIFRCYEGDWTARVRRRREMAEGLGIAPNALRLRVHRIRARLERCAVDCLKRSRAGTK